MTGGTKTALIIGGAAAGVFVLLKLFGPKPAAPPKSTGISLTSILGQGGLGSIGSGIAGLFKGGGSSSSGPIYSSGGTFFAPTGATDTASQQSYAISHGVTDLEGNQIIDENTGNALVYGTD